MYGYNLHTLKTFESGGNYYNKKITIIKCIK